MLKSVLASILLLAAAFVASCVKPDQTEKDRSAIRALVTSDTTHFNCSSSGGQDTVDGDWLKDDTMLGLWWRGPQTHDSAPGLDIHIVGDSAWVGWSQHNYGQLIHWIRTSDTTAEKWVKTLRELVRLNATFWRAGQVSETNRGWRLRNISLAMGRSDTINTVRIDSLRIHSSLRDILIVDPLNSYYRVDSLITFTPGEQLTLTLYTNATEGFAWLHAFWGILFVRLPFEDMGNGIFQGTWNAQYWPGFRFAIFDLMTRNTLLHKDAPYDYSGWLLPYFIRNAD